MRPRTPVLSMVIVMIAASCGGPTAQSERDVVTTATSAVPTATSTTTPSMPIQPSTTTTSPPTSTTTEPPPTVLPEGLLCRNAHTVGYGFAEALAYWVRDGTPDRMDEDGGGIPCETVYPGLRVRRGARLREGRDPPDRRPCRDVLAAGYGFGDAPRLLDP